MSYNFCPYSPCLHFVLSPPRGELYSAAKPAVSRQARQLLMPNLTCSSCAFKQQRELSQAIHCSNFWTYVRSPPPSLSPPSPAPGIGAAACQFPVTPLTSPPCCGLDPVCSQCNYNVENQQLLTIQVKRNLMPPDYCTQARFHFTQAIERVRRGRILC